MSQKLQYLVATILVVLSFCFGHYTAQSSKSSQTTDKIVDTVTHEALDTHTKTTITEVKEPTGEIKTITQVDTVQSAKETDIKAETDRTVTTYQKKSAVNISLIGGYDTARGLPTYGASFSKEFVGPITIGLWGLTNGTVGVTIGVNF